MTKLKDKLYYINKKNKKAQDHNKKTSLINTANKRKNTKQLEEK